MPFNAFIRICLVGLLLIFSVATETRAEQGAIIDLRIIQTGPNQTRLIIDATRSVPYRAFVLNNPMRLVIDFPLLQWQAPMNKGDRTGRIRAYRHSVFEGDTRRIVFDLRSPLVIKNHQFLPPSQSRSWQYIFDVQTATAIGFQQALKQITSNTTQQTVFRPLKPEPQSIPAPDPIPAPDLIPAMETSPVLTAKVPQKKLLIVLDPGHGGVDPGAIATNGVYEKNITLATARRVKDLLESSGRYRVHMTRDRDIFIKLPQRVKIARDMGADLFISLHADTIGRPTVQGASVYTLSDTASDAETAKLAERENAVDSLVNVDVGDVDDDVADILIDLVTRDTMNQSKVLAQSVVTSFKQKSVAMLPQRPHRSAGFAVLKAPDIPSVLIEMGYLSNRSEANRLNTPEHQQRIAEAVVATINRFFEGR
jgi:N-acetylmuramoyl-L-alanine amidase